MNEIQAALRVVLANTFVMYFKTHSYHWNVEGVLFSLYHDFFGDLYSELHGAVDDIAEHIRKVDGYAPISISNLLDAGTLPEDMVKPVDVRGMLNNLLTANDEVMESLNKSFAVAESIGNQGLMDFLAGRIDTHSKHRWVIRSSLVGIGA